MLYELNNKKLSGITRTSFHEVGVYEGDLQEALRERPEFIEQGLFVISDEFTDWDDSWRHIDLLCIDHAANLVVVELKRADGAHMELQAIRYAAMMANSTTQRIIEGHARYLRTKGIDGSAEERIREHLGLSEDDEVSIATEQPRIVLVSEEFNKEITTSVLWLNEAGLDIRCVRVRAFAHEGQLLLNIDQVIPLPEAQDFLVKERDREKETRATVGNWARRTSPGIGMFEESLKDVAAEQREKFEPLLAFARNVEDEGLARLESYTTKSGASLRLYRRDGLGHMALFNNDTGTPFLYLRHSYFADRSPQTLDSIWTAFGQADNERDYFWTSEFPQSGLDALYHAFAE